MSINLFTEPCDEVPPGPEVEESEGDWLAWRAVISPALHIDATYDSAIRHKILFVGHDIASTAWFERRRARRLYRDECAEQGREPEAHASLVIYLPFLFHGVCLSCPWVGEHRLDRASGLADALDHQQHAAAPAVTGVAS